MNHNLKAIEFERTREIVNGRWSDHGFQKWWHKIWPRLSQLEPILMEAICFQWIHIFPQWIVHHVSKHWLRQNEETVEVLSVPRELPSSYAKN